VAKLLWNPDLDSNVLIADFLKGYYGNAAPFIQRYIGLMQSEAQNSNAFMDCFLSYQQIRFLSAAAIQRADDLMQQAEKSVSQQPELLERIQFARLAVRYMQVMQATANIQKNSATPAERAKTLALLDEFKSGLKNQKANRVGEWERDGVPNQNLQNWLNYMKNAIGE